MASIVVRSTSDPVLALRVGEPFLLAQPEHNSIILGVLTDRVARYEHGRYWWACRGDDVVGFAMHSSEGFRAVVAPAGKEVVEALVDVMAGDAPGLPGVMAEAATAAAFAGHWAEARGAPVTPVEAQRLYRVHLIVRPAGVAGDLRPAAPADRPVLLNWTTAFLGDIESNPFDPGRLVDRHMTSRRLWVWDLGDGPVSMASVSPVAGGVARVGFVYTPPEHRRHGYAAACVAALSEQVLAQDAGCILHTQLHNPTSNGVYRRIGYVPLAEVLIYRFG